MTDKDLTQLCPHFDDGETTMATCPKCNGREDANKRDFILMDVQYLFTAKFHPMCAECDRVMSPGDIIAHLTDGRNVCGECAGVEQ